MLYRKAPGATKRGSPGNKKPFTSRFCESPGQKQLKISQNPVKLRHPGHSPGRRNAYRMWDESGRQLPVWLLGRLALWAATYSAITRGSYVNQTRTTHPYFYTKTPPH